MNDFNEKDPKEFIDVNDVKEDKVIPAIVKSKKKSGKGKVVVLTAAVALASFGAGSLYTSYNWIAKVGQNQSQTTTTQAPTNSNAISQTITTSTNGGGLTVAQVAEVASQSIVEITTEVVQTDVWMRQYVSEGAGSGVIISQDGYIVTNNHVIDGASKITVRLKDGKEYQGQLVGTDAQTDLAVVKIDGAKLQPVAYGNSDQLVVGDTAIAIGNPLGKLGGTVTNGIISATDRQIEVENQTMTLLQTNAAINPGNSGGGLFNDKGELIGVVVAKSAGSNVEGLGFAIPSNVVKDVVASIMEVGYVQGRPVLGISVADITTAQQAAYYNVNQLGVYVLALTEGTKAEASGLKVGDCIIAIDDTQVNSKTDIATILKDHQVGDKVKVMVSREGKMMTLNVELSESKPQTTTANQAQQVPQQPGQQQGQQSEQTQPSVEDIFNQIFGNR